MAFTTPKEFLPQPLLGSLVDSGDRNQSPNRTVTIHNIPGEVLLEIFDHYRQSIGPQISTLRVWNNKNGWFKLAHVCHKWRCIVFASSRRLRLLLFFAESTPTRAVALQSLSLSHLPIIVDYSRVVWNASAQTRFISALRYPDRVAKIAINGSRKSLDKVYKALDLSFPALASFELHNMEGNVVPILLASSLMTSIKPLRHLRLANVRLSSLLPLLSVTRALMSLDLTVDALLWQTGGVSLLTHLQHIPHLREVQVFTRSSYSNYLRKPPITTVLLAELSCFKFSGQCTEIEWFVAGLKTPSLRELQISVTEPFHTLHIPHLSKFIRVAGIIFFAARVSFLGPALTTSMFAPPHSINNGTRIVTFRTPSGTNIGSALAPMLATLEDIFLCNTIPLRPTFNGPRFRDLVHWRKFFEELRNVKVLRLHYGLETEVADVLRQPAVNPPTAQEVDHPDATKPSDPTMHGSRSTFALDILPLLEKIVVYARPPDSSIGVVEPMSGLQSLREYAIPRQQVGRPVEVLWDTERELPRYYTLLDVEQAGGEW